MGAAADTVSLQDGVYLRGERCGGKSGRSFENEGPFVVAVLTTEDGRWHLAYLPARPFTSEAMKGLTIASKELPVASMANCANRAGFISYSIADFAVFSLGLVQGEFGRLVD